MKAGLARTRSSSCSRGAARAGTAGRGRDRPLRRPVPAQGAHGLFVPGAGDSVSGEGALAALLRGKTKKSVLGGVPGGQAADHARDQAGRGRTIYVSLPPRGEHPNTHRYPIAIVGPATTGSSTSRSTRIRGLVSIADIAPTARALERGKRPVIRSQPDDNAVAHLAELDRRLPAATTSACGRP